MNLALFFVKFGAFAGFPASHKFSIHSGTQNFKIIRYFASLESLN